MNFRVLRIRNPGGGNVLRRDRYISVLKRFTRFSFYKIDVSSFSRENEVEDLT